MVEDPGLVHDDGAVLPDPYEIVSIRAASAPSGLAGADWYRYEISQGTNRIVGYRTGAAGAIRDDVELIVTRLNLRRKTRRGRVHVVLQPKAMEGRA